MADNTNNMKRIMGIITFQNMDGAQKAMDALEDAGFDLNIRHDCIDDYTGAVFVEAWRYVAANTDKAVDEASSAILDELNHIVDPFHGLADDVGVFPDGVPHDAFEERDLGVSPYARNN